MLQSLLTIYVGKNGTKRKKVLQVLNSMSYNEQTKEYSCKSTRTDKTYIVFYSESLKEWVCNCEAITWKKNRVREETNRLRNKNDCIHIIASKLYSVLQK